MNNDEDEIRAQRYQLDWEDTFRSGPCHMELEYMKLLFDIRTKGEIRGDRTGVGTVSLFGRQLRCNIANGFPLITTKKVFWKGVVEELLWFMNGRNDVKYLKDRGINIWNEWEKADGTIGPGYGSQWRAFGAREQYVVGGPAKQIAGVDQLKDVIARIKSNPQDRRLIVSAWNPVDLPQMALPPCHMFFQFYVSKAGLSCHMYQRSADMFLGVPFNIASYALLTYLVAHECGLRPAELIISFGDAHIYQNHLEQVAIQLGRVPAEAPTLQVNPDLKDIFQTTIDDLMLEHYKPLPAIKAPVAV